MWLRRQPRLSRPFEPLADVMTFHDDDLNVVRRAIVESAHERALLYDEQEALRRRIARLRAQVYGDHQPDEPVEESHADH